MATRLYRLTQDGSKRLALSWGTNYSNFTVRLDGQVVGIVPNKAALQAGQGIQLGPDSQLYVYLERNQIHVSYNGRTVSGSPGDPQYKLNQAVGVLVWVCISTIAFGFLSGSGSSYAPRNNLTLGIALGSGILYGVLAFFVRSRSKIALWIAVGFYALDTLGVVFLLFGRSGGLYIVGLFVHILFLRLMWNGFAAIDALQAGNYNPSRSGDLQPLPGRFPSDINSASEIMVVPPTNQIVPPTTNWTPPSAPVYQTAQVDSGINFASESKPSAEQLLRQAVDIVKRGGDRQQARSLVNEALKIESRNADGWYLIGYLADTKAERKAALERTLALNPNHQRAQQEFAKLTNG